MFHSLTESVGRHVQARSPAPGSFLGLLNAFLDVLDDGHSNKALGHKNWTTFTRTYKEQ